MMSFEHQVAFAEERRQRLLKEAEMRRLVSNRTASDAGRAEQVLASLGDLLIASGTKLKERAQVNQANWSGSARLLREADR